jgi:hypothetical protein
VQDADEDRALDRKLETAIREQVPQHIGDREPLPQPPEEQR